MNDLDVDVTVVLQPRPWVEQAACAGMDGDLFFPEGTKGLAEAKAVCAGCPVRTECLDDALARGEKFGIWGGLSAKERHRLRRGLGLERRIEVACKECGRAVETSNRRRELCSHACAARWSRRMGGAA